MAGKKGRTGRPENVSKKTVKVRAKTGAYANVLGCGFRVRATCANVLADIRPFRVGWKKTTIAYSVQLPPHTDGLHGADGGWEKGKTTLMTYVSGVG